MKIWFLETRPQFLLLTPVCVFAGIAASLYDGNPFNVLHFLLAFVGALFAHISVNVLNDYFDYKSGVDLRTSRTPFSGGSGILPAGMLKPMEVYWMGVGSLAIVIAIGIYFLITYGWAMLPLGLGGVLLIYFYTPYITKLSGATELIGPGLGFGLMVLGTYFTQTGNYSIAAVVVTLVAGMLIANLLLLNEFPDVEADRIAGRRHLPIVLSREKAAKVYCCVLIVAYVLILVALILQILPLWALLGLGTLPLGIKAMRGAMKYHNEMGSLVPYMGINIFVVLLTPLLMSCGIMIGTYI